MPSSAPAVPSPSSRQLLGPHHGEVVPDGEPDLLRAALLQVQGGGFLKIISVGIPTYASMKTGF